MIISRQVAMKLLKDGKAQNPGLIHHGFKYWIALDRVDLQRVDHFEATEKDIEKYSDLVTA